MTELQRQRERTIRPAMTALALFSGERNKAVEKAAMRASRVEARELEESRRQLQKNLFELQETFRRMKATSNMTADAVGAWTEEQLVEFCEKVLRLKVPEKIKREDLAALILGRIADEREKLSTFFQYLSTYTIAGAIIHATDYLCVQFPREVTVTDEKTGEKKRRKELIRFTLGDMLSLMLDLTEGWGEPNEKDGEPGVFGRLDQMTEMLNDLGVKNEAWMSENGEHDPFKYFARAPSNKIKADQQETSKSDDEDEPEEVTPQSVSDEELERAKRGEIDVPDLRRKERASGQGA